VSVTPEDCVEVKFFSVRVLDDKDKQKLNLSTPTPKKKKKRSSSSGSVAGGAGGGRPGSLSFSGNHAVGGLTNRKEDESPFPGAALPSVCEDEEKEQSILHLWQPTSSYFFCTTASEAIDWYHKLKRSSQQQ